MQTQGVPEKKSLLQLCGVYPVIMSYRKPMNKRQGKTIKRGCQHPSNKCEILCQVAQNFFTPTFIFCSPVCSNNCGVAFLWKYILVFEKWLFAFDRSNMQIFTVNIAWVVWPHETIPLDLRHFCQHNPLFYHLHLFPCHYWSWQRNIYFLVNIFVWHTFPMSKSSIKTKTVLTMIDMT